MPAAEPARALRRSASRRTAGTATTACHLHADGTARSMRRKRCRALCARTNAIGAGHLIDVLLGRDDRQGAERRARRRSARSASATDLSETAVARGVPPARCDGDAHRRPRALRRTAPDRAEPAGAPRRADRHVPRRDASTEGSTLVQADEPLRLRRRDIESDVAAVARRCARCAAGLAKEQGVPAYVIFNDATLREIVRMRPTDLDAVRDDQRRRKREARTLRPDVPRRGAERGLGRPFGWGWRARRRGDRRIGEAPAGRAGSTSRQYARL